VFPANEYTRRLNLRDQQVRALEKESARIGAFRLAVAGLIAIAAFWSLRLHAFAPIWLLVGIGGFAVLVSMHQNARRSLMTAQRAVAFYKNGLARIEDRWEGSGQQGTQFEDPHHVYASDLDLFGKGSLFELLCRVRTRMGEQRLAQWLLSPAPIEVVRERQASVTDLKDRLDLREALAVLGEHTGVGVHPAVLLEWAAKPNRLAAAWLPWIAVLFPLLAIAGILFWWASGIPSPFFLVVLVEAGVLFALRPAIDEVLNGSETAFEDLRLFAQLLTRVEVEQFAVVPLQALLSRLSSHAVVASRAIGRLSTIVSFAGSRRNQLIALVAVPLMYPLLVALAAERWRRVHGGSVASWVDVIGELEARLSLAAYAYEHPDDPFPELVEGAPVFSGTGLGHPLIPASRCVRNDVSMGGKPRILLVSGSNMSGKSTLLRTVGINTVLAMAGAPVRAETLRLTAVQIGASIRINDSLHDGSSRFYAEITRLRQLFDLADGDRPLLFLLDELLQGTNSRDRRSGAEGIVRALAARGALGLISTHDLALTEISGLEPGTLRNVHFQDELHNGRMTFDFKLRDGVVTKSNAMELMRSIGLEV
jgi:MutS domain V